MQDTDRKDHLLRRLADELAGEHLRLHRLAQEANEAGCDPQTVTRLLGAAEKVKQARQRVQDRLPQ